MMQGLISRDHAYAAGGDVYFDVTSDPDYGKLCHRDPEQMEAGARIEVSEKKRGPGDFALWKAAKPGEPAWDSPWGRGRPGWHIECSAMSMKLLGETLDIHGGGLDLQFPHHENELAQTESFTGKPFVRYWMHNGLLKMGTTKMAGSVGNVINVVDLLARHQPETVRFLLLSTHYRSPIEYSEERLHEVRRSLEGFYRYFERFERIAGTSFYSLEAQDKRTPFQATGSEFLAEVGRLRDEFLQRLDDDFNTGGAVGTLHKLLPLLNRFADARRLEEGKAASADVEAFRRGAAVLKELGHILGLFTVAPMEKEAGQDQLLGGLMQLLIDLRAEARKAKNFAMADTIRKRLAELGVTLEDRVGGTLWRRDGAG